jgi:uncharacterized protein
MAQYLLAFVAGVAGSLHCLGMCSGFVCMLGGDARGRAATLQRHLLYNLGRVTSYCFVGALVGEIGMLLMGAGTGDSPIVFAQRALAVGSGALMVFFGLQFFGLFRAPPAAVGATAVQFVSALRDLLRAPGGAAPLAAGVLNGFLPCPLVYAFAAQAAGCGSPMRGMLTMVAFGLGTFPTMLVVGALGSVRREPAGSTSVVLPPQPRSARASLSTASRGVTIAWRRGGVRLAGAFIVLLGLVTLARGVIPFGGHVHGL